MYCYCVHDVRGESELLLAGVKYITVASKKGEFTVQLHKQLSPSIEQQVIYRSFVLRVRQVGEKGECSNLQCFLEMS